MNYLPYQAIVKDGKGAIVTNLLTGEQSHIKDYKAELIRAYNYFQSINPIYKHSVQYKNILKELEKG